MTLKNKVFIITIGISSKECARQSTRTFLTERLRRVIIDLENGLNPIGNSIKDSEGNTCGGTAIIDLE
jgi:hypothetical protein